jgi:hypothetical protein
MRAVTKAFSNQFVIFVIGMTLFFIVAAFGWEKLHYGFNFLDEGCHMTESWRLAAGDHFLKDRSSLVHMLSTVINSIALFRVDKQYWYQPFIFSLFAFTGLSPAGWNSNLNYHSYPHLFITWHISFFILGLTQKNKIVKRIMFIASGVFLWGISFTLLHLSIVVLSPILLFFILKNLEMKSFSFEYRDLYYVLAPFFLCWMVFIGIYNTSYIVALYRSIGLHLSAHPAPLTRIINWEALKHVGISMPFLALVMIGLRRLRLSILIIWLAVISLIMFLIIDTSLFGIIAPYHRGWFSRPMWFSALFISFFILFLVNIVWKHFAGREYNRGEELSIILLVPCAILFLTSGAFSTGGLGTVLYTSIPATAAIASIILYDMHIHLKSYRIKALILTLFFLPFYYTTAWSDWRSTCFDVFPEQANVTIDKGFGKGIKTNRIYYNLYEWIRMTSKEYADRGDFMISYVMAPMAHMISKLRPALDHSWISLSDVPADSLERYVELMKERRRYPKIAFVFESIPAFYPISLKENKYYVWFDKQFTFPSEDPISKYITENMTFVSAFKIHEGSTARCYVDNIAVNRKTSAPR